MKFLPYNPEQAYLLPPRVADVLGKEHLCFFLRRVVDRLDLNSFEEAYEDEGRPAYAPELLVAVWLYAYALGVTSSRRLEQRVREDLALAASLQCRRSQRSVRIGAEEGGDDTPPGAAGRDSFAPRAVEESPAATHFPDRPRQPFSARPPRLHFVIHGGCRRQRGSSDRRAACDTGGHRQCFAASRGGGGRAALRGNATESKRRQRLLFGEELGGPDRLRHRRLCAGLQHGPRFESGWTRAASYPTS